MATLQELTNRLNQALKLKAEIDSLQEKLDAILDGTAAPKTKGGRIKGKRTMSPATISKMRAAQQARWAHLKGASTPAKATPKKKGMSPEQNAKIAAVMKARWAAKRQG